MKNNSTVFGGVLLVAGTAIGAGMLGLPIVTAAAGFAPTILAFLIVWFFMTTSGLAYLEVCLRFKGEHNFISLTSNTLGKAATALAWAAYIFFLYSLMAAYTAGGNSLFFNTFNIVATSRLESGIYSLMFVFPFALTVYLGALWVDRLNRILVFGLFLSFAYISLAFLKVEPTHDFHVFGEPKYLLFTLPVLMTSFGYQNLIPTLKTYLNENVSKLRKVIIIGGLLPLMVYAVWVGVVMYLVPTWGDPGLVGMLHGGGNPGEAISNAIVVHGGFIQYGIMIFSFTALTSSFIGVGLGISDFLADGLHIQKTKYGRLLLAVMTFAPPIAYTMLIPEGFLLALTYAGVFSAILLVIYPVLMAWHARYIKKIPGPYKMAGGKLILIVTILFGLLIIFSDAFERTGLFPKP